MDQVAVGVLGTGYMGAVYARVLAELRQANLVGLCDVLEDKARNLSAALGLRGYAGRNDVFAHDASDLRGL